VVNVTDWWGQLNENTASDRIVLFGYTTGERLVTKIVHEFSAESMAYGAPWQGEVPANRLQRDSDDDASSENDTEEFLADLADRIAAACLQSESANPKATDRAVPLQRDDAALDDYCRVQPMPAPGSSGVMIFNPDGHLRSLAEIEADVIRLAVSHYQGRISEIARRLNIGRTTLYRKIGELGIVIPAARQ
jgi:DNA-binding NtrC family response regulator